MACGDFVTIRDLRILGANTFESPMQGIVPEDGFGIKILNVVFEEILGGSAVLDGGGVVYMLVEGCQAYGCGNGFIAGGQAVTVSNCWVLETSGNGIVIGTQGKVSGCHVENVGSLGDGEGGSIAGIESDTSNVNVSILGNEVFGVENPGAGGAHGILVEANNDHCLVHGNVISGAEDDGVHLTGGATPQENENCKVTDNVIYDCGTGIHVQTALVVGAVILNNDIRGNSTAYTDVGTGTINLDQNNAAAAGGDNII